ncbi:MFS transporter [bacterium]|nr:MFS transporter [bacterium]
MNDYRNVASLTLAVMLLQAAAGILSVSTPLALQSMGAGAFGVGLVAAVFSLGFMVGAWFAPQIVLNLGHIRSYGAAAAIYAAGILAMALEFDPYWWAAFRVAQGAASAVMFAAAESWIADATPRQRRGAVLGLYQVLIKVAMAGGPLLVLDHAPEDVRPFIWAGLIMTLAVIPISATQRAQPAAPTREAFSLASMRGIAPAALVGALVAGVANTGVMSQLPLYAAQLRPAEAQSAAATLAIAAWMGGVVSQWPAGLLSDRIDRRFVVAGLALIAAAAAIALFLSVGRISWFGTVALAALWGGGAMSFYSVSASHAIDRADRGEIARVLSAMLFIWAAGSVVGPVIFGWTAETAIGQPGVFAGASVVYGVLIVANLWRILVSRRPPGESRSAYAAVGATSVATGEIVAGGDGADDPA